MTDRAAAISLLKDGTKGNLADKVFIIVSVACMCVDSYVYGPVDATAGSAGGDRGRLREGRLRGIRQCLRTGMCCPDLYHSRQREGTRRNYQMYMITKCSIMLSLITLLCPGKGEGSRISGLPAASGLSPVELI